MAESDQLASMDEVEVPDIDKSPVTTREFTGWLMYGFASEGYSALGTAVMLPIILETMAAQSGVTTADYTKPCDLTMPGYSCVVQVGSVYVNTSSFVFYCTSISTVAQFILFVSISSFADHGDGKKKLMLWFGVVGAILGLLFIALIKPSLYWAAALLYIISNIAFCASYVFFYSWVPVYARNDPEVIAARGKGSKEVLQKVTERRTNSISAQGFAWGYGAAVVQLIIAAVIALVIGDTTKEGTGGRESTTGMTTTYRLQIGVAFACLWWLVFMIFPLLWMKNRPGPPLPKGENPIVYSWKTVGGTLSRVTQLGNLFRFLLAWFVYSDAFSTIVSVGILFAKTQLGAGDTTLLLVATLVPFCAGVGSVAFMYLQRALKFSTRTMIMIQALIYSILCAYCLLGFVAPIGIKQSWEIWFFGAVHGLLLGSTQSFCRSLFSELLPPSREAEFFGLYEVTDKGSSWIGPLIVGAIQDVSNPRNSFYFLLATFLASIALLFTVNVDKGRAEGLAYAEKHSTRSASKEKLTAEAS
ncbi:autophagy-related protein 22-like protein [Cladochytrium replicatum]|nr:autophagy-related protein 22-like protein [Cladochytrium replicatum]